MNADSDKPKPMSLEEMREFLNQQMAEMLGPFNMWVAGVNLNHPPSKQEAALHFAQNGGSEWFRKKYNREHQIRDAVTA